MLWLLPVAAIAGTVLVLRARASAKGLGPANDHAGDDAARDRDVPEVAHVGSTLAERAETVRQLAYQVGAPPAWANMFALIARGESGGDPLRMLGIHKGAPTWAAGGGSSSVEKKEAAAARSVYESGAKKIGGCGWPAELYAFGSGGLYAMLPMSGLKAFWSDFTLRCLHPWSVFDAKISTIMAAHFAHRLTKRKGYKGTVWSLRRGWGVPGDMASASEAKLAKWRGHAQSIGLAPSFLDTELPPWTPIPARDMFQAIGADRLWLPASMQEAA